MFHSVIHVLSDCHLSVVSYSNVIDVPLLYIRGLQVLTQDFQKRSMQIKNRNLN